MRRGVSSGTPSGTQVDSLGDLIPFAIAAAYLFLKFASRKKPGTAAPAPAPRRQARSTAGPTPFEQLLARLEAGINEAGSPDRRTAEAPAAARPLAGPTPRRESVMFEENRAARAASEARSVRATAFRSLERSDASDDARGGLDRPEGFGRESSGFAGEQQADFEHTAHGFGAENPYSEPAFEAAADADRRRSAPERLGYDPHARPAPPAVAPSTSFADRLRSREALRDAFVLSTILARRPALRQRP